MGRQLGEELDVVPRPVVELAGKPCGHALKELPGHVPIQSGERGWSAFGRRLSGLQRCALDHWRWRAGR